MAGDALPDRRQVRLPPRLRLLGRPLRRRRVRTFLIYLATPVAGGGTHFRALDVLVEARERRLVVWEGLFPDGSANHSMIHAGLPLLEGEKITLVTWQRQRAFRRTTSSSTKEVRAK